MEGMISKMPTVSKVHGRHGKDQESSHNYPTQYVECDHGSLMAGPQVWEGATREGGSSDNTPPSIKSEHGEKLQITCVWSQQIAPLPTSLLQLPEEQSCTPEANYITPHEHGQCIMSTPRNYVDRQVAHSKAIVAQFC